MRPTTAHIDLKNLRENIKKLRELSRAPRLMAVVKAQAYGHGGLRVAEASEDMVDYFGVATVREGIELRRGGIKKPIAVLGGFFPGEEDAIVQYGLEPAIYSLEQLRRLSLLGKRRGKPIKAHLKIDTGLGRLGFSWREPNFPWLAGVELVSAFTTLAAADNQGIPTAQEQHQRMLHASALLGLRERGILISIANSAGVVLHPELHEDMVRPGILLYGVPPYPGTLDDFKPVMSVKTIIINLKEVSEGTPLGYGGSFITKRKSLIATLPMGYYDGVFRSLSNRGWMWVKGKRAPIVGKVSMDLTLLDVTDINGVKTGDEVIFFSDQKQIWEVAEAAGTIPYEVLCRIGERVLRIYHD